MAEFIVTQTIVTPTRRIPAGATVRDDDLDGPLTAADWLRLGFLSGGNPPPLPAAPRAADTE